MSKEGYKIFDSRKAEEYIYSSAIDYYYGKQCLLLKVEFLF
jgi:hypothetical protein